MGPVAGPIAVIAMTTVATAPEASARSTLAPWMDMVVRRSRMRMGGWWRSIIVISPITARIGRLLLLPGAGLLPLIVLQPSGLVFNRRSVATNATAASGVRPILAISLAFPFPIALSFSLPFPLPLTLVGIPVGL